jgi:hypothetical protein
VGAQAREAGGEVEEAGVATLLCHLWFEYLAAAPAAGAAPGKGLDAALAAWKAQVTARTAAAAGARLTRPRR